MSSTPLLFDAPQVPHETDTDSRRAAEAEDARAERRLKDAVRRYYALAELVETERGYVDDLRILVEVYLMSLGVISVPALGPRAEAQPAGTPDIADGAGSACASSRPGPSSPRPQAPSYQYPPSSFPPSAVMLKEHAESQLKPKPKPRARPASIQVLSALQPQYAARSRRDSGLEPYLVGTARSGEYVDREVKVRGNIQERTLSVGFVLGSATPGGGANARAAIRRTSVDYVQVSAQPTYHHTFTISPDSSPHPSPSLSPASLPSIPSTPQSSHLSSPLPTPPHRYQRHQRLRTALTDADRRVLARGAQEILTLHERIVLRVEDALSAVQREVAERKRAAKGKDRAKKTERADREQEEVECEIEAAVRAVCGVFVAEASNFTPYEAFCAGHTEALDTARRAMRVHASEWLEWEKRCAETAARQDVDGTSSADAALESSLPSPSSAKPVARRVSRNSLLSGVAGDGEDARSSTSTLRRRHSAYASSGSLRTTASAALKHTKSDPTPPVVGYGHSHAHAHTQGYGLGSAYSTLSVKRLSRRPEELHSAHTQDEKRDEKERQREQIARMKLAFSDYLIKPVQRVCKYPLLFEQLRSPGRRKEDAAATRTPASAVEAGNPFTVATAAVSASRVPAPSSKVTPTETKRRSQAAFSLGSDSDEEDEESDEIDLDADESDTDAAIERVLRKMRDVAHAVDEAQRRRDLENKSSLIVERLVAGAPGGSPCPRPVPMPDANAMDDEKGSVEDGGVQSYSELGHGTGAVGVSTGAAWPMKPPTRSLSFSSAFSRSRTRSGFGRTNSAFMQHQLATELGEMTGRTQVPGPPTRVFLSSLGACLLAGSLDIVVANIERPPAKRREGGKRDSLLSLAGITAMGANNGLATAPTFIPPSSRDPVKVKYLAAFLYVGGYVVLAKTPKAGVYEPRHWFALSDETIEIVDVREEKALLPCSFHLVFHATGHRLELAAACQREKEIWLNAIHHARSLPPVWDFEPVPTLNISANLVNTQITRNSVDVPPVPSMPAKGDDASAHETDPSRMPSNSTLRNDATIRPNRRQSVNGSSMRAFFMSSSDNAPPAPSTVLIRRVSATRRAQTDRYLADVLSQPLLSARFHAKTHDEVLFRDPDPPQQGTGIGVGALAKNKLMARESVLVSKQCAPSVCSSIASSVDQRSMVSDAASSITVQRQNQYSARGKAGKKSANRSSLSTLLTLPSALTEGNTRDSRTSTSSSQGAFSPDSPLPSTSTANTIDPLSRSQCSSASTSAPTSSPVNELFPPEVRIVGVDNLPRAGCEGLPEVLEHMDRPKRSRSLVDSFRGFFGTPRSLSSSPAPSMSSSRQASVEESLEVPGAESGRQGSMLSRILKSTSFRPRGRSTSDVADALQASSSSSYVSASQADPARPSFISRSSSMLVMPRRRPESSAGTSTRSPQTPLHFPTSAPLACLTTRPSRSSLTRPEARQKSLGRSIKYRLFPGSLVPLTPMECSRDRMS